MCRQIKLCLNFFVYMFSEFQQFFDLYVRKTVFFSWMNQRFKGGPHNQCYKRVSLTRAVASVDLPLSIIEHGS